MKKQNKKLETRKEKIKESAKKFKLELKKSMNTAIVAAFGFLIALSWRDVITEYVNKVSEASPVKGKLISAILITTISILGILIATKFFSVGKDETKIP